MFILPRHYDIFRNGTFTSQQLVWIAVAQYFMLIVSLVTLSWIFINIWRILIKQRKYKVLPLMSFYTAAVLNVIFRFFYTIWFFSIEDGNLTIFFMEIIMTKFMIGIDQSWINIELCLIINYSLKYPTKFPIRCIKIGRIAIAIFISVLFTTVNILYFAFKQNKTSKVIGDFVLNQYTDYL